MRDDAKPPSCRREDRSTVCGCAAGRISGACERACPSARAMRAGWMTSNAKAGAPPTASGFGPDSLVSTVTVPSVFVLTSFPLFVLSYWAVRSFSIAAR